MTSPDPTPPVPRAALDAALADILDAPADAGTIAMLVRRPALLEREQLDAGRLDTDSGLVGDTWSVRPSRRTPDGSPHPGMQLTLMGTRVADAITGGDRDRWALAGDQVFVDLDLSEDNLPVGTRLQVGQALVEVSDQPHTGCAKFGQRFGADALRFISTPQARTARLRGVNVAVVASGAVAVGDTVVRLS